MYLKNAAQSMRCTMVIVMERGLVDARGFSSEVDGEIMESSCGARWDCETGH